MTAITNTLTRKKEALKPVSKEPLLLYVCGITPYDFAHIGHGRCYVTFDLLVRFLRFSGYTVTYCRNFTDIDDKLLARAEKELGDKMRYAEVAQRYIDAFTTDVTALNCATPTIEPRVTTSIESIITFVQGLIGAGYAYEAQGDVYYRVRKFTEYGKLSHRSLDDLEVGARVEVNNKKEDPLDFALWKGEASGTFWKSPWGYGRPGWHIECSAMAYDHLGKHIDIHGGGMDLIFPHHENEIAQSEALFGAPFAKLWIHNAFVRINQEKMSKSLNNFFTLRDVFAQFDPMIVRFYYLQHHYRSPLDFSFDGLAAAEKAYRKLCIAYGGDYGVIVDEDFKDNLFFNELLALVGDDLNSVGALGLLFSQQEQDVETRAAGKLFLQKILGLSLQPLPEKTVIITVEIQKLIDEREAARIAKDWAKADALREKLIELGVEVQDKKG